MTVSEPAKVTCKAHVKDICFSRMYITNHFDAPFENFRLDLAVHDLVEETGVKREQLLPLTCFIHKGYLFTVNNRRLWVLRHVFMFSGKGEEVDVVVLPDNAMPERKDYVARLQFHKLEALVHPKFWPIMHGDKPQLQKYIMRPIVFRFDTALRNGYRILPGGRLLCINAQEAAVAFQASAPRYNHVQPGASPVKPLDEDDKVSLCSETPSMASVDFPGKVTDVKNYATSWSMEKLKNLPTLKEDKEEEEKAEEEEKKGSKDEGSKEEGKLMEGLSDQKKKELVEVAKHFKAAVSQLRLVLDNLDQAFDKLAA